MNMRKLRKHKQEQQGWPDVVKHKSCFDWPNFWNSISGPPRKFVHQAMRVTTWKRSAWRWKL